MKVLIAVDGSEGSHEAVRQAATMISPDKDRVAFYYSVPDLRVGGGERPSADVVEKARTAFASSIFEAARAHLPAGFHASLEVIAGSHDPRRGLLAAAEETRADVIAVGARGVSPLKRLLLGSVSRATVQGAHVPVLVARKSPDAAPGAYRVLWAHDQSAAGDHAGRFLSKLTFPKGAVAHALTVTESILPGDTPDWIGHKIEDPEIRSWIDQGDAAIREQKRLALEKLAAFRKGTGALFESAVCHVKEGHPAEMILDTIREHQIDLVVLGARRQSSFARFVLGSTSESIVTQAPCSVLVVREHDVP